jgi:hypothetical protein
MAMRGYFISDWQRELTYDRATQQLVMLGSVRVVRKELDGEPLRVNGEKIIIDVQETAGPTTRPTTGPATRPAGAGLSSTRMEMKHLRVECSATEEVQVISTEKRGLNLRALSLDYDPVKHELTVRGTADHPAHQLDEHGLDTCTFTEAIINTVTMDFTAKEMRGTFRK